MTKPCKHCGTIKSLSEYGKSKYAKSGLTAHCKSCERLRTLRKRQKNPLSAREAMLRSKYGITSSVYLDLALGQNNKCKICGHMPDPVGKPLSVDHCHVTGRIRGLLCQPCNTGLGLFKDDLSIIFRAVEYLKTSKTSVYKETEERSRT